MTRYDSTYEGGASGGTVSTSSAGTALHFVNPGSGTIQYDGAQFAHGALAAKHSQAAGSSSYQQVGSGTTDLNATELSARFYMYRTDSPGAAQTPMMLVFGNAAGTVRLASINFEATTGKMYVRDTAGTVLYTTTSAVATNTWVRIEMRAKVGAAGVGAIAAAWYTGDSTTADFSYSNTTTANMGSTNFGMVGVGKFTTEAWATAFWIDDIAVDNAPTGAVTNFIGPVVASATSTATPSGTVSNAGAWAATSGTVHGVLSDSSDASYVENPGSVTSETVVVSMTPLTTGNISVKVRCRLKPGETAGTFKAEVRQGASVIATFNINPTSTSFADYTYALTTGEQAAVTDRTALRVALIAN